MKIRNKIIALMFSLIAMPTFALAKDGPYLGAKYAKIDVDYKKIDGVDLNQVFPTDFNALDLHVGYNLGNSFFEFGYINANKESRGLGSTNFGTVTLSASTNIDFDGYRISAGYNFPVSKEFKIKPFINYYELDLTASGSLTVTAGTTSVSATSTISGTESMIDAGIGFDYVVNDRTKIGLSYARTIDSLADTNKVETLALSASYQF